MPFGYAWIIAFAGAALVLIGVFGIMDGAWKCLVCFPAAFGLAAIFCGAACLEAIAAGDMIALDRTWNGLGDEPGGWRMSRSLSYLLAAAVFLGGAVLGVGVLFVPFISSHPCSAAETPRLEYVSHAL